MEGSQDDNPVELQDNDFSFVPTQSSGARDMSSTKRKRKRSNTCEPITADSLLGAAMMLSEKLESVGDKISKSLGTELTLQQKIEQLEGKLSEIEGLEYDDKFMALIKLPEYPNQMLSFTKLSFNSSPTVSMPLSDNGFQRAQSEGNLEGSRSQGKTRTVMGMKKRMRNGRRLNC
nr:DNA replication terminus site-binding [Ipomoea batatas]